MVSQGFLEHCQHQGERFEDTVLLALKMLEKAETRMQAAS